MNDILFSPASARTWFERGGSAAVPAAAPASSDAAAARPPEASAGPVLEVSGLGAAFSIEGQWREVVRNVSFTVGKAETVAIVGESGSGKSVTALSIMRLLAPGLSRVTGSVRLAGRELLNLDDKQMAQVRGDQVAMIFQEPMTSMNPVLTVGVQIAESLVRHRQLSWTQARAEAIRLLDRVRIPSAATRYDEHPHRFSGGMRQRAMIAMALACRPRLLIADEPTTALDVTIQAQILDLIKVLQDEDRMAVLFITHDMGVVAEVADRVLVMYRGEHVESGSTAQIFARPVHPYTGALLAAVPRLGSMANEAHPRAFDAIVPSTGAVVPAPRQPDTVVRTATPLLKVENLGVSFDVRAGWLGRIVGRTHAVENVSFTLQPGETLSLVGESGSGKSTVGRSIVGLIKSHRGSIKVGGQDVATLDPAATRRLRARAQMIFQDPYASLDPRQTVGASIGEPILAHRLLDPREATAEVQRLLEQVGLDAEMARRYPHEFSGGQRQRICIARALGMRPELIVADEAVSALDATVKCEILNLLLDLQSKLRLAYLFISHDMAVVERMSHRVAVMYMGEIVEIGPRPAVFADPQHDYTRRLLAAVPISDPSKRRRRSNTAVQEVPSALRAPGYVPMQGPLIEVAPGHWVLRDA